ncbi:MAG: helix-turn-helix domain-containing protein [Actinomycetota bacterium]|nr:helix-turn-helix domain-containing protein [Actinomycetota bacterium]
MSSVTKMLSLSEAAEHLGLHYMTVYKYVRSGKLAAQKNDGSWQISKIDLDKFSSVEPAPAGRGRRALGKKSDVFRQALVAGDQPGSWSVIHGALDVGVGVEDVICEVVVPALRSIGDEWARGQLRVYEEHRASNIVLSILGRMQSLPQRRGRKRGSVLIACPPLETHGLPAAICAELIRSRGFSPINLGADTPVDTLVQAAVSTDELAALVLSTVSSTPQAAVFDTVNGVSEALPGLPIIVGGVWSDLPDNVFSVDGFPAMLEQLEQLSAS